MRRSLLIAAGIIVVIGIALAAYFYFFAGGPGVSVAPPGGVTLPSSGQSTGTGAQTASSTGTVAAPAASVSARLVEISAGPIAPGEAVVDMPAANASPANGGASSTPDVLVKYIERQSGNVFSYSENAGQVTRTSNRTVPGIERAYWLPDGTMAFVQYLSGTDSSTINTYGLPADSTASTTGFFLPQNLAGLAVSSAGVLALASGVNGSAATLYHTDGTHGTEVFTTPLSAVRTSFAGKSGYFAFTSPSSALPGYAYLIDSKGRLSSIAGPLTGLAALPSPDGAWALVSSAASGVMHLALVNTATGQTTALPVATIADKCAWAADSSAAYCGVPVSPPVNYAYPDDWYQGAVTFSDRIWKIDVSGRFAELVLDFSKEASRPLDAEALAVDPNNQVLTFVNKIDGSLWGFKL